MQSEKEERQASLSLVRFGDVWVGQTGFFELLWSWVTNMFLEIILQWLDHSPQSVAWLYDQLPSWVGSAWDATSPCALLLNFLPEVQSPSFTYQVSLPYLEHTDN